MADSPAPKLAQKLIRPNLKPRRAILWMLLAVFAVWVGLLTWVYVTQILLKHA